MMDIELIFQELNVDINNVDEKWNAIRIMRSQLLKNCDWTQLPDAALTLEEKTLWSEYRQALRDLPQTYNFPEDVIFPNPPGGA